ncbi:hypothetical protein GCM10010251_69260 [Streptomyces aurantiogriseus]|uniref:Uncharacterized protein n=1 Tax=Streptomyces aurantiogriseus TaxID=66870 RepID=A0A918KY23_9ACTN|nr:hypothetical protein GCM10010251_69260 [Streptomyces aurantiogriseus]
MTPRETTASVCESAAAGTAVVPMQAAAVTAAASRRVGVGMADLLGKKGGRAFLCGSVARGPVGTDRPARGSGRPPLPRAALNALSS